MNSRINSVTPKEDRERVKEIFQKSDFLLDILEKVCYNIIRENQDVTKSDYSNSSWSHEQAHRNGIVEGMNIILQTIKRKET